MALRNATSATAFSTTYGHNASGSETLGWTLPELRLVECRGWSTAPRTHRGHDLHHDDAVLILDITS
jgi:hypothetical protein